MGRRASPPGHRRDPVRNLRSGRSRRASLRDLTGDALAGRHFLLAVSQPSQPRPLDDVVPTRARHPGVDPLHDHAGRSPHPGGRPHVSGGAPCPQSPAPLVPDEGRAWVAGRSRRRPSNLHLERVRPPARRAAAKPAAGSPLVIVFRSSRVPGHSGIWRHETSPGGRGGALMWMPGALIGGLLAYQIYSEAWALGAAVGALAGLLIGRALAKPPGERRLGELESRFTELTARLDWIDRRLATLERADQPAPATATPPPSARPEPPPFEPPIAPAETIASAETVAPAAEPAGAPAAEAARSQEAVFTKALRDSPLWRWLTGGNTVVR